MIFHLIIQALIIGGSLFFWLRFVYYKTFQQKDLRSKHFSAIALAIYYLPVFYLGLILIWLGVAKFYTSSSGIYHYLSSLFGSHKFEVDDNNLDTITAIVIGSILLTITALFAKAALALKKIQYKILAFIGYILFILISFYYRILIASLLFFSFNGLFVFNSPYYLLFGLLVFGLGIVIPHSMVIKNYVLKYYKLAAQIVLLYIFLCTIPSILLLLKFWFDGSWLQEFLNSKKTKLAMEWLIKATIISIFIFIHAYATSKIVMHKNKIAQIIALQLQNIIVAVTVYYGIKNKTELNQSIPLLVANLVILLFISVFLALTQPNTKEDPYIKRLE